MRNLFISANMFDLYIIIHNKTSELMILDRDVIHARSYLRKNREFDCPLIVLINVTGFSKRLHSTAGLYP